MKNIMFKGLCNRLVGQKGLHPIVAIELATANYPKRNRQPLKPPIVPKTVIWKATESFLDKNSISLEEAWQTIWNESPEDYFEGLPKD